MLVERMAYFWPVQFAISVRVVRVISNANSSIQEASSVLALQLTHEFISPIINWPNIKSVLGKTNIFRKVWKLLFKILSFVDINLDILGSDLKLLKHDREMFLPNDHVFCSTARSQWVSCIHVLSEGKHSELENSHEHLRKSEQQLRNGGSNLVHHVCHQTWRQSRCLYPMSVKVCTSMFPSLCNILTTV